jgi:hypothetical protein
MLKPIIRLTLHCGLGYSEFSATVRRAFIDVASEQFGVRGRPANISRISAKTGLPRKVVSAHRSMAADAMWSPDDEISPINTVIHYWRFDDKFCVSPGNPRELASDGSGSFTELVKRYAGDIPATTIWRELYREGLAEKTQGGKLRLRREYSFPESLDEDFIRNAAFSIRHHAETVVHNALLVESGTISEVDHQERGWFERIAWSRRLGSLEMRKLQLWVRAEGAEFIQRADEFISRHEDIAKLPRESDTNSISGVGLYFFGN